MLEKEVGEGWSLVAELALGRGELCITADEEDVQRRRQNSCS